MCIGKSMGGGAPVSAAIGTREIMEAWGTSSGEAIHTSTFLGNPLGCAMSRAAIQTVLDEQWPDRVSTRGAEVRERLEALQDDHEAIGDVRGRGLMLGIDLVTSRASREADGILARRLTDWCLERGYLVLPSGVHGNVLSVVPPFVITDEQLDGFFEVLDEGLSELA